jgi:hypothetical protein
MKRDQLYLSESQGTAERDQDVVFFFRPYQHYPRRNSDATWTITTPSIPNISALARSHVLQSRLQLIHGTHGIVVPGTLRDSLVLFTVMLEQQTELNSTKIMTDTGVPGLIRR